MLLGVQVHKSLLNYYISAFFSLRTETADLLINNNPKEKKKPGLKELAGTNQHLALNLNGWQAKPQCIILNTKHEALIITITDT